MTKTLTGAGWRIYTMMTSSNGNIFRFTGPLCGGFPSQRPVTRNFDVFFDLRRNKQLSKYSWGWWFETPSRSLGRHCHGLSRPGHIIDSGNGLSPGKAQSIATTNDDALSVGYLRRNFTEIWVKIYQFSYNTMNFKMSSANCRPH